MIPSFVIFLREGFEASLIISILLSYLNRTGQRRHFRDVFVGVGAALLLISAVGVVIYLTVSSFVGSRGQLIFETATFVLAATSLTYMTFWMRNHSRGLSRNLETKSSEALSNGSRFAIVSLSFLSIAREGLETMIFMLAIIFASRSQSPAAGHSPWILVGAILGLVVALAIAYAMFKLGTRINLKRFFLILAIALLIFAAGLLADAVENLQKLGWITAGNQALWHSGSALAENSSFGDVLHMLFGYAQSPTVLQAIVWVGFLATTVTLFIRKPRAKATAPKADTPAPTATAPEAVSAKA